MARAFQPGEHVLAVGMVLLAVHFLSRVATDVRLGLLDVLEHPLAGRFAPARMLEVEVDDHFEAARTLEHDWGRSWIGRGEPIVFVQDSPQDRRVQNGEAHTARRASAGRSSATESPLRGPGAARSRRSRVSSLALASWRFETSSAFAAAAAAISSTRRRAASTPPGKSDVVQDGGVVLAPGVGMNVQDRLDVVEVFLHRLE